MPPPPLRGDPRVVREGGRTAHYEPPTSAETVRGPEAMVAQRGGPDVPSARLQSGSCACRPLGPGALSSRPDPRPPRPTPGPHGCTGGAGDGRRAARGGGGSPTSRAARGVRGDGWASGRGGRGGSRCLGFGLDGGVGVGSRDTILLARPALRRRSALFGGRAGALTPAVKLD